MFERSPCSSEPRRIVAALLRVGVAPNPDEVAHLDIVTGVVVHRCRTHPWHSSRRLIRRLAQLRLRETRSRAHDAGMCRRLTQAYAGPKDYPCCRWNTSQSAESFGVSPAPSRRTRAHYYLLGAGGRSRARPVRRFCAQTATATKLVVRAAATA